jgi:hypothetical protein
MLVCDPFGDEIDRLRIRVLERRPTCQRLRLPSWQDVITRLVTLFEGMRDHEDLARGIKLLRREAGEEALPPDMPATDDVMPATSVDHVFGTIPQRKLLR